MTQGRLTIAIAAASAAALGLAFAPTASASGGDDVVKRGACSGASHWKLKAGPDNGRIEVEGEVDSNVNGQTWHWKIRHNGHASAHGTRATSGPSGSFEVHRRLVDTSGRDRIGWRARNLRSGEVCQGALTV